MSDEKLNHFFYIANSAIYENIMPYNERTTLFINMYHKVQYTPNALLKE